MHRDCDEGEEAIRSGAPVVSLSLGSSAVFEFQPPPESGEASSEAAITRSVHLLSGDALLFGGPARLMPHGRRTQTPPVQPVEGAASRHLLIAISKIMPAASCY